MRGNFGPYIVGVLIGAALGIGVDHLMLSQDSRSLVTIGFIVAALAAVIVVEIA